MATTQAFVTWTPKERLDGRFLLYLVSALSPEFDRLAYGSTHLTIYMPDLEALRIPVPPLDEQRRIAAFLDDQVARIDQVIALRERQLALLSLRLQASVDLMVMSAESRVAAARLMTILPGYAFPSDSYSSDPDDIRLLRGVNVDVSSLRWDDVAYWPRDRAQEVARFLLYPGDVVLGMDRPFISSGLRIAQVGPADSPALLLQRVAALKPGPLLDGRFMYWSFRSTEFRRAIEVELTGLSVPHLSGPQIGKFRIPLLSRIDQTAKAQELDQMNDSIVGSSKQLFAFTGLLQERKRSLITAAVTGEFDISSASTRALASVTA